MPRVKQFFEEFQTCSYDTDLDKVPSNLEYWTNLEFRRSNFVAIQTLSHFINKAIQ